jgi:hypothetical protein
MNREEGMRKSNGDLAKEDNSKSKPRRMAPARSVEARENQLISLAMDLAEQQLRDGTASSQIITEFIKRGSTKERIEKEILEKQRDLVTAKTDAIKSSKTTEELYGRAIEAMRSYSPTPDDYED